MYNLKNVCYSLFFIFCYSTVFPIWSYSDIVSVIDSLDSRGFIIICY